MDRRDTILGLLALSSVPFLARAQPAPKLFRIGVLGPRERFVTLAAHLRELGYEEGRNVEFVSRSAEANVEKLPALAAELIASKVDLIVTSGNAGALAAKAATSTIPIVVSGAWAPVEHHLVDSLSHPGGNVTGTAVEDPETAAKKLEVLHAALPMAKRVTVLFDPHVSGMDAYRRATELAAKALGVRLTLLSCDTQENVDKALKFIANNRPDGLYVVPTAAIFANQKRILQFAVRQRLPAMYTSKELVLAGGLMSYTADHLALHRRAAGIVDRILKGAKPSDIPVEQPTKYELVINLKTAKAIGLKIPQELLISATQLIE